MYYNKFNHNDKFWDSWFFGMFSDSIILTKPYFVSFMTYNNIAHHFRIYKYCIEHVMLLILRPADVAKSLSVCLTI